MKDLKSTIKGIPLVGDLAVKMYRILTGNPKFSSSGEYWESRYMAGGNSGTGSYNILAEYKGEIINDFVRKKNIDSVIEFGSGDGNQLKYFNFKSYVGFDVSPTVINNCRKIYAHDPTKRFEVVGDYIDAKAELVMSLDVIYHLVEDDIFFAYMENLFRASSKYVLIYSSNDNDHENNNVSPHVKHRNFTNWVAQNITGFKLIDHIANKYAYNGDELVSSYADFYFYEAIS